MSWQTQHEVSLPSNTRAESAAINFGLIYPSRILDLGIVPDDFYDSRRRRVWRAMLIAISAYRDTSDPWSFYLLVRDEIARDERADVASVLCSVNSTVDWSCESWDPDAVSHDVSHVVEQIKRCVVARKLIDAAYEIAARAYRVPDVRFDVVDASVVLSRIAGIPQKEELGMELPI